MIILFEWIVTIILFFLAIGQFNGDTYYNNMYEYAVYSKPDYMLGSIYFIASCISAMFAFVHTQLTDESSEIYPRRYDWNAWDEANHNAHHQQVYAPRPNGSQPQVYTHTIWTSKTTQEVVKDITKDYPQTSTVINEMKRIEIKKKPLLFNFGKKKEEVITTTIIPPKHEKVVDSTTPTFCFIETTKDDKSIEDVQKALSIAIMEFIPQALVGIVNKHIVHIERTFDNINIFYRPSVACDMAKQLNRNCILAAMRKTLGIKEIGKIKMIEIKGTSFEDYYAANYGSKGSSEL